MAGHATPQAVFDAAQAAMAQGDWDAFFECVDEADLKKIAGNGLRGLPNLPAARTELEALCQAHGFPLAALEQAMAVVVPSAERVLKAPPEQRLAESLRHKTVVEALDDALLAGLKQVTNLPAFTAGLERTMRAHVGGGSVSSTWFQGERLEQLKVDGAKATGVRILARGQQMPLAFKKTKHGWRVKLLGRVKL